MRIRFYSDFAFLEQFCWMKESLTIVQLSNGMYRFCSLVNEMNGEVNKIMKIKGFLLISKQ